MPQFDQASFLNQIFWLFFIFLNFYFFVTYFFLPFLCENLKFRKKKLIENTSVSNLLTLENKNQVSLKFNTIQQTYTNCDLIVKKILIHISRTLKPEKYSIFVNFNSKHVLKNFYMVIASSYSKNI